MYDESYFENRGIEQKHYAMSLQWLKYLMEKGVNLNEAKFYDYGCARGPYVSAFRYYGFDIHGYDINSCAILNPVQGANEHISGTLSCDEFDTVLCIDCAEHVEPKIEEEFINNLSRLTKKEGYLIMSICDITLKDKYYDETHVNLRSREYWIHKFEEKGFTSLPVPDWFYYNEQLYIFHKGGK